ncbi:MAG: response regulator [Candidatus Omnitrophota bacterium]
MAEEAKPVVPKRILLVDDDLDLLFLLSKTIESWGYKVITASSGKEAVACMAQASPDILILDYKMPDMNGIDTLKEIRKTNTKILAILFTADLDSVPIKGTENLGIATFIPKWYPESMLKTAIMMAEKKIDEK